MKWVNACAGASLLAGMWGPCVSGSRTDERVESVEPAPSTSGPAAEAPARPAKAQTPTAKSYMRGHFAESEAMRRAVVAGDLDGLHSAAAGLAGDEWTPNLRADWRPHVAAVRSAARAAQSAISLQTGAAALGELGTTCANCHQGTGGPRIPSPSPSPQLDHDRGMVAHDAATARLWAGLVAPSDAAWIEGARQMLAAPELDSDVADVAALTRRMRDLAKQAEAADPAARPRLLGEMLLACSGCHSLVGTGAPGRPK